MTELNIQHLDDDLFRDLERRASLHGCSVEEELNSVLRRALGQEIPEKTSELTPQEKVKALKEMFARRGVKAPPLSDEAISRSTIYGERG